MVPPPRKTTRGRPRKRPRDGSERKEEVTTVPSVPVTPPPVARTPQNEREEDAARRREDLTALKQELEDALADLGHGRTMQRNEEPSVDANGRRRTRAHRDFLLQEMEWMAADFTQERKWRRKTARSMASSVQAFHSKQASREARREKTEEDARRRRAARLGRDVKKFWGKIDKVISFKVKLQSDELRKAAMDRQLKNLVAQTERYAAALAVAFHADDEEQNCEDQEDDKMEVVTPENGSGSDSDFAMSDGEEEKDDETTIAAEESLMERNGGGRKEEENELILLQEESTMSVEALRARYAAMEAAESTAECEVDVKEQNVEVDDEIDIDTDEGVDSDYSQEEEVIDDETTIDIDEQAIGRQNVAEEIRLLVEESTMSIEELKTRYSEATSDDVKDADNDEFVPEADWVDDEHSMEEVKRGEQVTHKRSGREIAELENEATMSIDLLKARYSKHSSDVEAEEDDGEFVPQIDQMDDEHTIEEAECAEQVTEEERKREIAELEDESTMSLDQLRAKYGLVDPSDGHDANEESSSTDPEPETSISERQQTMPAFSMSVPARNGFKRPFLLTSRLELREYQEAGVNWLVSLWSKRINGILADEMGLGKTIQTITLLAHLACSHAIWGPHLIVVPTSCMVNWEMECKRWCPALKVLTYYGGAKRRKALRQGWSKFNAFHVCITSYQLVVQDAHCFRRKHWYYMILDEAHNIKNWKSLRWQTLLHFHAQRRLLLTGTPLQNNLLELWSLMHFLMPHVFASRKDFSYWFQNPLTAMVEGEQAMNTQLISQLHGIIRPFVLRRLKKDVATQLPGKFEHVVMCPLSKRQRCLYEDFLSRSSTRRAMFGRGNGHSGNFMGMMNVLMQLRKVCNHPDLFEPRPIASPLDMPPIVMLFPSECVSLINFTAAVESIPYCTQNLRTLEFTTNGSSRRIPRRKIQLLVQVDDLHMGTPLPDDCNVSETTLQQYRSMPDVLRRLISLAEQRKQYWLEKRRCQRQQAYLRLMWEFPMLGADRVRACTLPMLISAAMNVHRARISSHPLDKLGLSDSLCAMIRTPEERLDEMSPMLRQAICILPKARASLPRIVLTGRCYSGHAPDLLFSTRTQNNELVEKQMVPQARRCFFSPKNAWMHRALVFPDKRLLQFDCGKLQELDKLLRQRKRGQHRCLIFTQMSAMLNVLEAFLTLHGHTYFRLDGSTPVERRQFLLEKFNRDDKIFCFILSTRSGGLGINLTGADTVIFYDSDWNPAMDAQAQDRAHRIGQTRDVHIYRLVSTLTVEENILKKAQQKRHLDTLVLTEGQFTTDFFSKANLRELVGDLTPPDGATDEGDDNTSSSAGDDDEDVSISAIEDAMAQVEDEEDVVAMRGAKEQAQMELREFEDEGSTAPTDELMSHQHRSGDKKDATKRDDDVDDASVSESASVTIDGEEEEDENEDRGSTTSRGMEFASNKADSDANEDDQDLRSLITDETEENESMDEDDDDSEDDVDSSVQKPRKRRGSNTVDDRPSKRAKENDDKRRQLLARRAQEKAREQEEERELQAWKDSVSSLQNFEDSLNPVDRYALHFREDIDPLYAYVPTAEALQSQLAAEEAQRSIDIEAIEAQKEIDEQALIEEGELIAGVTSTTTDGDEAVEQFERMYKKERARVLHERRKRQLTGTAWKIMKCAITGHPFYYNIDTREATWDRPVMWIKNEQYDNSRQAGYAGLPSNVLLRIFACLTALPERAQAQLVCKTWHQAIWNQSLFVHVRASSLADPYITAVEQSVQLREVLSHAQAGETIFLHAGVYELHDIVEVQTPVRLIGAPEAHVELQMVTPRAQLRWSARGGVLCGFCITRRKSEPTSYVVKRAPISANEHWQHLVNVVNGGRVRIVYCTLDGQHEGNACVAVSGNRSELVLQGNRIFHAGNGSGVLQLQGFLIMQRNTVHHNAHSGISVFGGHALLRRNHVHHNGRFGVRLAYHAYNVIIEENKMHDHPCNHIDAENSGRRFVVRSNEIDKEEDLASTLPHRHSVWRLHTFNVKTKVIRVVPPNLPALGISPLSRAAQQAVMKSIRPLAVQTALPIVTASVAVNKPTIFPTAVHAVAQPTSSSIVKSNSISTLTLPNQTPLIQHPTVQTMMPSTTASVLVDKTTSAPTASPVPTPLIRQPMPAVVPPLVAQRVESNVHSTATLHPTTAIRATATHGVASPSVVSPSLGLNVANGSTGSSITVLPQTEQRAVLPVPAVVAETKLNGARPSPATLFQPNSIKPMTNTIKPISHTRTEYLLGEPTVLTFQDTCEKKRVKVKKPSKPKQMSINAVDVTNAAAATVQTAQVVGSVAVETPAPQAGQAKVVKQVGTDAWTSATAGVTATILPTQVKIETEDATAVPIANTKATTTAIANQTTSAFTKAVESKSTTTPTSVAEQAQIMKRQ